LPNQNWLSQHNPNQPVGWPNLRIELAFWRKGKDASPFGAGAVYYLLANCPCRLFGLGNDWRANLFWNGALIRRFRLPVIMNSARRLKRIWRLN
jgi:hypothetical protein